MRFFPFLLFVPLTLNPPDALAWGADAHRLIAELAERQLEPSARAEADRLLSQQPGATLVSVATWADEVRRAPTAPLHYVNLPDNDCNYDRRRDCKNGNCVVEAINEHVAVLKSKASDAQRLVALKYVIHLVGDIHQPLHVGLAADKGGNLFQVRAFGRGTNLHAVWDSELIRRRPGGLSQLREDLSAIRLASGSRPLDSVAWARYSCAVSRSAHFYPLDRTIDAAYQARWDSVLLNHLTLAGQRLAQTLNEALGKAGSSEGQEVGRPSLR